MLSVFATFCFGFGAGWCAAFAIVTSDAALGIVAGGMVIVAAISTYDY